MYLSCFTYSSTYYNFSVKEDCSVGGLPFPEDFKAEVDQIKLDGNCDFGNSGELGNIREIKLNDLTNDQKSTIHVVNGRHIS